MIVVDASTIVDLLLSRPVAPALMDRLFSADEELVAPHLLDVEVPHVFRRHWLLGDLTDEQCRVALDLFAFLPIERHSHAPLVPRVWELRDNLTTYDAMYVALAEVMDAPLVTRDTRLARSAGHTARIELIE